jgi:hypothetical protein
VSSHDALRRKINPGGGEPALRFILLTLAIIAPDYIPKIRPFGTGSI